MILGYSTNAFVRFSVFEAVEKIGRLGFGGVEIMCDRPHLYPPDYGEENLTRLKTVIDDQGLKVTNLNSFTLFAVGDTYLPSWIEPQEERREIRIQRVAPLAQELDIMILVEPEPDLLMENTREFKEFIVDVKSPAIGVNFDIGHFFCAGEDPRVAFEELFEWIGHVHLEDIAPDRVHNHLILGQGAIQFAEIFQTLSASFVIRIYIKGL